MFKKILFLQFFYLLILVTNGANMHRYQIPQDDTMYTNEIKQVYESPIKSKTITSSIVNTKVTNITYFPIEYEYEHHDNNYSPDQEYQNNNMEYLPDQSHENVVEYESLNMDKYNIHPLVGCDDSDHLTLVEYDCQKFKMCANGKLIILSCPNDLIFDTELKICNFRENVNGPCGNQKPIYY